MSRIAILVALVFITSSIRGDTPSSAELGNSFKPVRKSPAEKYAERPRASSRFEPDNLIGVWEGTATRCIAAVAKVANHTLEFQAATLIHDRLNEEGMRERIHTPRGYWRTMNSPSSPTEES
jgi:hypothetical protein